MTRDAMRRAGSGWSLAEKIDKVRVFTLILDRGLSGLIAIPIAGARHPAGIEARLLGTRRVGVAQRRRAVFARWASRLDKLGEISR